MFIIRLGKKERKINNVSRLIVSFFLRRAQKHMIVLVLEWYIKGSIIGIKKTVKRSIKIKITIIFDIKKSRNFKIYLQLFKVI